MKRSTSVHRLGAAAVALALLCSGAVAAPPTSAPEPTVPAQTPTAAAALTGVPGPMPAAPDAATPRTPAQLTPMMQDIQSLLDQERTAIAALRARIDKTSDRTEVLQLQREAEQAKRQTLLSILEVQLRYARAEGRTQVAEQLESALALAKNPMQPPDAKALPRELPPLPQPPSAADDPK